MRPSSSRNSVVLPAPLAPTRPDRAPRDRDRQPVQGGGPAREDLGQSFGSEGGDRSTSGLVWPAPTGDGHSRPRSQGGFTVPSDLRSSRPGRLGVGGRWVGCVGAPALPRAGRARPPSSGVALRRRRPALQHDVLVRRRRLRRARGPLRRRRACARCTSTCSPSRPTRRPAWHRRRSTPGRTTIWSPTRSGTCGRRCSATCGACGGYENDLPDYRLPRPSGRPTADAAPRRSRSGEGTDQAAHAVRWRQGQPRQHEAARAGGDRLRRVRLLPLHVWAGRAPASARRRPASRTAGRGGCTGRGCSTTRWTRRSRAAYPELGISRIVAAETVSSYWTALPVALQHGFTEVALGITRSTDEHNLVWDKTGEEINYLWGMSAAAEQLLHDYVRRELVANLTMFHLLRPIYDVNVFSLLRRDLDAVPRTHSCAQQKPWCCRCAKCLYVWMNYVAWLPPRPSPPRFDVNLFDIAGEPHASSARCSAWRATSRPTASAR